MAEMNDIPPQLREYRKQIDQQFETKRHYENLSWQLIRLLLSIIGFLVTTISILASIVISRGISVLPDFSSSIDLEYSAETLHQTGIVGEFGAAVAISILSFSLMVLFIFMIHDIFIGALRSAFRLQRPEDLKFGPNPSDFHDSRLEDIHRSYQEVLSNNQDLIDHTEENWNTCLDYLRRGGFAFAISSIAVLPSLILSEPGFILLSLIALAVSGYAYLANDSRYREYVYFDIKWRVDALFALNLAIFSLSFLLYPDIGGLSDLMFVLSFGVGNIIILTTTIALGILSEGGNRDYIRRNILIVFLLFLSTYMLAFSNTIIDAAPAEFVAYILLLSVIFSIPSIGFFLGGKIRDVFQWLWSFVNIHKPFEKMKTYAKERK